MSKHERRQTVYSLSLLAEVLRLEATKGDAGEYILAYLPKEDMMNMALDSIGLGDKMQDAHNSKQWYKLLSTRRLRLCINTMQETTGSTGTGGYVQAANIEPDDYVGLAVVNDRCKV